ncbi:MAG: hypothetical protein AABY22_29165, partial [Nanoarchaeota archaeon]
MGSSSGVEPRAVVVHSTARLGGLDLLHQSIARQSTDAFDVVLVDYWWEERRALVAERFGGFAGQVVHVPPRKGRRRGVGWDGCQAWNTGFAVSRAVAPGVVLVIPTADYWIWSPRFVEQHLAVFNETHGVAALVGPHEVHALPVESRSPKDALWSAFVNPVDTEAKIVAAVSKTPKWACRRDLDANPENRCGRFRGLQGGHTNWYGGLNESIPRWALEASNGLDESLDGVKQHVDTDWGRRLAALGLKFVVDEGAQMFRRLDPHELPPRYIFDDVSRANGAVFRIPTTESAPRVLNGGFDVGG